MPNKKHETPAPTVITKVIPPEPAAFLGIVVNVDGKDISLAPKTAISNIARDGIDVGLPEGKSVALGSTENGINGILKAFTGSRPNGDPVVKLPDVKELPDFEPLQKAYAVFLKAQLTIEDFHVKIPGTATKIPGTEALDKNKYYTVGLSATWDGDDGKLFGDISIKGIYLEVSNERAPGYASKALGGGD